MEDENKNQFDFEEGLKKMRKLVSDVQGAPYPGDEFEPELYKIWYEHIQKSAVDCFEYLNDNFPPEKNDFSKTLGKFFD